MPEPITFVLGNPINTYTYFVGLGLCAACGVMILSHRARARAAVDVFLVALVGAIVVGRAVYVALDWRYFAAHPDEITRLTDGGLVWHGAFVGALLAAAVMSRARGLNIRRVMDTGALILPLMAYAGWWGCAAARCAYGAEVVNLADYAPPLVWEQPDIYGLVAPRFATQALGAWLAVGVLALAVVLTVRGGLAGRRLGLLVMLFSAGMLVIDGLRGDIMPPSGGLSALQWLDILGMSFGAVLFIMTRSEHVKQG